MSGRVNLLGKGEWNMADENSVKSPIRPYGQEVPKTVGSCGPVPPGIVNLNVEGRRPTSPDEGFGAKQLRTYRVALPGVSISPREVISAWKADFGKFWPEGNIFHVCGAAIEPGVAGLINLTLPGGIKLYTGAMIRHVDEQSFEFMTLQGHMFSGRITFSAFIDDDQLYIQTRALVRPSDPLYEIAYRLGFGARAEDDFWHASLRNLARHFGVTAQVVQVNELLDNHWQWRYFSNIWYNAGIRSVIYLLGSPFRRIFKSRAS